jgi:hypothetical protein
MWVDWGIQGRSSLVRKEVFDRFERSATSRARIGMFPLFWTGELGCQMVEVPESWLIFTRCQIVKR